MVTKNVTTAATTTTTAAGKVNKINLSKTEMKIAVGSKDISYVTMLPETATDKGEVWTSSDTSVATVDRWGNVTYQRRYLYNNRTEHTKPDCKS